LQNIWFNKDADAISWPENWFSAASKYPPLSPALTQSLSDAAKRLNPSQQTAVNAMLSKSPKNVITIIQGPPGTGKTSVIAFYVQMAVALGQKGIWLVAQSNVAVKNIAEKLTSVGFQDYRLLVSQDFIDGW
jgi:regulator of nonsense transcripts 1